MDELPKWNDLPVEFRESFEGEEQYEVFREQRRDLLIGEQPHVAYTDDVIAMATAARRLGYNRLLSDEDALREVLDPEGVHVLSPLLIHRHAQGEEVDAHVRVRAYLKLVSADKPEEVTMDVPMDFWLGLPTVDEFKVRMGMKSEQRSVSEFSAAFWKQMRQDRGEPKSLLSRTNEGRGR